MSNELDKAMQDAATTGTGFMKDGKHVPIADVYKSPAARALMANTDLLTYVLQDDIHNRLTPRVVDIAYTAFMTGKQLNAEDGGPSDWFNDTRPVVMKAIERLRKDLLKDCAERAQQTEWQPIESAPLDGKPLLLGWYTTWPEVMWVCAIAPAGMDGGRQGQNYRHGMATHWKPHPESVELSVIPPICSNCQSFMPAGCRGLFESDEACMRKQHPEGIAQ